jgi:hypothetical protein
MRKCEERRQVRQSVGEVQVAQGEEQEEQIEETVFW